MLHKSLLRKALVNAGATVGVSSRQVGGSAASSSFSNEDSNTNSNQSKVSSSSASPFSSPLSSSNSLDSQNSSEHGLSSPSPFSAEGVAATPPMPPRRTSRLTNCGSDAPKQQQQQHSCGNGSSSNCSSSSSGSCSNTTTTAKYEQYDAPSQSTSVASDAAFFPSVAIPVRPTPPQNPNATAQRPYPVEGGAVPIYQMANGRIQKRHWVFNNPSWCDLCKEPVSLWANHMGRKDHALLDLHYSAQAEYPRSWNPEVLLKMFDEYSSVPFYRYQEQYSKIDKERREEIFALIKFLEEEKVLHLGDPRQTFLVKMIGGLRGMDHQGALVMHRFLLGPFMRLFPDGGIQDYSNLVDFITCGYNMETVYDLCGFQSLDLLAKEGLVKTFASSPAALGLGGLTTGSSSAHGFNSSASSPLASDASASVGGAQSPDASKPLSDQEAEESFSRKAVFIRSLLGQLRWSIVEDQVHPTGKVYPHHILLSCELLIKSLIAEIIAVRLSEYMVRVEPRWIEFGLERKVVPRKEVAAREITPSLVQYYYRPMSGDKDDLYSTTEVDLTSRFKQQQK